MYGLSSDVHPWAPEENRLCMPVVFVICGLAIVPKISWIPYPQAGVNSHEGLSWKLSLDGNLPKLLHGRERIKHDYLALAKML